jgi:hypothetical protein
MPSVVRVQDQHKDIREWIGHHKAVGAGKVYLYDTGSKPPLDTVVRDYIGSGFVEHIWSPPDFGNATNRFVTMAAFVADVPHQLM